MHRDEDPWSQTGRENTPFDQSFYLILNVAVGGTGGYFLYVHFLFEIWPLYAFLLLTPSTVTLLAASPGLIGDPPLRRVISGKQMGPGFQHGVLEKAEE